MPVNKVILVGNVGKDPETRYFDDGRGVANFSLATNEKGYTTANGIQIPDRTEWHNVVVWRKGLVGIVEKYVHKGSKIYIEGKIRTRSYDDGQGVKRYITEIYVDNIELLERIDRKLDGENKSPFLESSIEINPTQENIINPSIEQEEDDLPF
ncbi:MAG: single-stranded DNA-binding protein [Candidatus Azobacteroides pseudotrichonymphae]|jgi:single-strand DNA-binding protein|uniref:Single-stranded DNA-binding protein n=1 Tax=Azobacteroides pseudotrichonymphae genomovar. CFP2 TaxID=511995 RepID=B6YQX2_AZOPC|nr:single-stranded DNA-binding protein [Candidatus Azobacteroides pseudotrichonymphae]MDR0530007.1 single-stranded DNA-binding protein [Bacteroidales bacterium OttesenSCG-928-I14]BAG83594.1 single-strand DNA-binding protein [Candidatus Azobacteroides pseudotrichonymphae genomovar. CFP2]GMO32429.1 MAG: single-stranded DNA-binding protein [Candidatus Azobacteroides pseudotrichonymphae]